MSTKEQLEQKYKAYLAAVSEGRLDGDTLSGFVADQCIFNGNHFNPKQYGEYVANVTNRCHSGLQFNLVDVVIDAASGRLASKLSVSGKPKEEFFGFEATGRSVTFKEAAFYTFENGKIVEVYTIVDRGDVADSLEGKT